MRLHTNELTWSDVYRATAGLPGVYANVTEHGSRSHARAFEVSLDGNGYARNTGRYGAGSSSDPGATWDEWGVFLGRLFRLDPKMLCGSVKYPVYRDADHYSWSTCGRFNGNDMPADTHKRHAFKFEGTSVTGVYSVYRCSKCAAGKRYGDWERVNAA